MIDFFLFSEFISSYVELDTFHKLTIQREFE
jgi:hypothetical protein